MTQQQITFYGELFRSLSLNELKVEEDGSSLYMKKDSIDTKSRTSLADAEEVQVQQTIRSTDDEIKAPLLGIFHRASAPEEDPFVEVGDTVKKGDILCVIEAMKMMNEITATRDGVIVEICARENCIVEYGQTIFKIAN